MVPFGEYDVSCPDILELKNQSSPAPTTKFVRGPIGYPASSPVPMPHCVVTTVKNSLPPTKSYSPAKRDTRGPTSSDRLSIEPQRSGITASSR